jgi:hypothetical protein
VPNEIAIIVRYWVATDHRPFPDLEGIDEFRKELSDSYISIVHGRPAGAGGFTHLHVELLSTFALSHLVQLVLDGVAFDLIKHGTEAFLLRSFIHAYKRLRERNQKRVGIAPLHSQRLTGQVGGRSWCKRQWVLKKGCSEAEVGRVWVPQ